MLSRLLRHVVAAVAVAAGVAAGSSCRPEGQSGVHVVIRLDTAAWQQAGVFDHLTVTARGGGARGVACFFPVSGALRAVEASPSDAEAVVDPCADLDETGWLEVPTLAVWDLEVTPRTANFLFPAKTEVEVEVVAALGGRQGVGAAKGRAVASDEFPAIDLELAPGPPAPTCSSPLTRSISEELLIQYLEVACRHPVQACLSQDKPGRSEALSCGADGMVYVDNRTTAAACQDPALVFATDSMVVNRCATLYMIGHFARCKPTDPRPMGQCELTTDCDPPTSTFTVRSERFPDVTADLACLPPLLTPVAVPLLQFPPAIRATVLGTQTPTSSTRTCTLIIKQLAVGKARCEGR